jgi:AcrR family transcriptional regulator
MSPRQYQMGKRREQVDESRRRVLDAARALLREGGSYTSFTVDAVAKRADVARATVYYQFGTKTGLLEALCDDIAEVGRMSGLADAFTDPDPAAGLREFVMVFGRFWAVDRVVMRRLRALAALDPDVEAVIAARDARRLQGLTVLLSRFDGSWPESVTRVLYALTSFETYDALAGADGDLAAVAPLVADLAFAALGLANRADIAASDPSSLPTGHPPSPPASDPPSPRPAS